MTTNPPAINLMPCESSQIKGYGYDAASRTLAIQFRSNGATYHYSDVPPELVEDMKKAESVGSFFGKHIRGRFNDAKQPDAATGIVFGLLPQQEPKYTTATKTGRLVTRATGVAIPDDEPVFVLRAQDVHAISALRGYLLLTENPEHRASVALRLGQFEAFAQLHPERMKFPDTANA